MQTGAKGHFLPKCPSFQNSPPDCFGNSPLKGLNNASGGQGLWVSPAGSVGASAFGRGLHRRGRLPAGDPHPLDPASLLKKAWRKLYAMLYQTSVLCIFTFLLIYSIESFLRSFFSKKLPAACRRQERLPTAPIIGNFSDYSIEVKNDLNFQQHRKEQYL